MSKQGPKLPAQKFAEPAKHTKAEGYRIFTMPDSWFSPLAFIVKHATRHPDIAQFPGLLLSAFNDGDVRAIESVYTFASVAHRVAVRIGLDTAPASEEKDLTNAIVFLANRLAGVLTRGEAPWQQKAGAEVQPQEAVPQVPQAPQEVAKEAAKEVVKPLPAEAKKPAGEKSKFPGILAAQTERQ